MADEGDHPAGEFRSWTSDDIVVLVRAALIVALLLSTSGLVRQTPAPLRLAAIIAMVFTLVHLLMRLLKLRMPLQRQLSVGIDLFLITAGIISWPNLSVRLFQIYYIVVIYAAIWFKWRGAVMAAVLAILAYVTALLLMFQMQITVSEILLELGAQNAAALVLIAVVAGYLLAANERERARGDRREHEVQLARFMQREMLPDDLPQIEGYELAVRLEVAREVSGDLYGFLPVSEETLLVWVADVAGKGVHGMMHVSMLYSHLRAAAQEGLSPAAIAERVNRGVYDAMQPSSFASVFIAQLQLRTGRLTFTNCGHPPPMLLPGGRADDIVRLTTGTPLVGVTTTPHYMQFNTRMQPGDVLVITTDGVQEARNAEGEMFEDVGLRAALEQVGGATAVEIATGIVRAVRDFSGRELRDDAIVAVVRRVPEAESIPATAQEPPVEPTEQLPQRADDAPHAADDLDVTDEDRLEGRVGRA